MVACVCHKEHVAVWGAGDAVCGGEDDGSWLTEAGVTIYAHFNRDERRNVTRQVDSNNIAIHLAGDVQHRRVGADCQGGKTYFITQRNVNCT